MINHNQALLALQYLNLILVHDLQPCVQVNLSYLSSSSNKELKGKKITNKNDIYLVVTRCCSPSIAKYWPNIHILCVIKYDPPLIADMRHSALDLSQISQRFLPENISCFVSSLESLGKSSENDYSKVYDKGATSLVSCDCATPHHSSNFMQDKA